MQYRTRLALLVFSHLLLTFIFISAAAADTIILQNGDRLTGTITRKENNELSLEVPYAKTIGIKWNQIQSLATSARVTLFIDPGDVLEGTLATAEPGTTLLKETGSTINLDTILYINPPPYITGRGSLWKGNINTAMTKTDGNTTTENQHVDAETILRTKNYRYTLGAVYNRSEDNDSETEANIKGHTKIDRFLSRKWYGLANASGEKDRFQDLDLRFTAGLGVGYQVKETKRENLGLEVGLSYLREIFIVAENGEFPAFRWAIKYDRFLVDRLLQFFHSHELFVGLDYAENLLLFSQTGIRIPATKKIYILLQVNFDWDNIPSAGKERSDTTYLFGLGATW